MALAGLFFSSATLALDADQFEAYIIINKDTVRGHIITNDLESVHLLVNFETADGKITQYKPGEIKRFAINVLEQWRRYVVLDLGQATGAKDTGSTLVFAQVISDEGPVKAYKYRCYQNKSIYSTPGDLPSADQRGLISETCLIKGPEVLRLQRTSVFGNTKKKLREFFSDCPTVLASLNNVKNAVDELPGLVRQYNRCRLRS